MLIIKPVGRTCPTRILLIIGATLVVLAPESYLEEMSIVPVWRCQLSKQELPALPFHKLDRKQGRYNWVSLKWEKGGREKLRLNYRQRIWYSPSFIIWPIRLRLAMDIQLGQHVLPSPIQFPNRKKNSRSSRTATKDQMNGKSATDTVGSWVPPLPHRLCWPKGASSSWF